MFDKGQLSGLMKKAKEMQDNLAKAQDKVAALEVGGESGAGMVKVVVTGKHYVKSVTIDPTVMDDKEMLEDLIAAAFNDASRKIEEESNRLMSSVSGGMPGLGGMKLPF